MTPTASRIRLYRPLRPPWTRSPARPLLSLAGTELGGGGDRSLNVVKESVLVAEEWILSKVWSSCSLSTVEMELTEVLRLLRPAEAAKRDGDAGRVGILDDISCY